MSYEFSIFMMIAVIGIAFVNMLCLRVVDKSMDRTIKMLKKINKRLDGA